MILNTAQKYPTYFAKLTKGLGKLKFLYYCALSVVAAISNFALYELDKNNEKAIIESFLTKQAIYFLNIVNTDLENILNDKNPKYVTLLKNYQLTTSDNFYDNSFIEFIHGKNNKKVAVDFISALNFIEELANNNFDYCLSLNNKTLACRNPKKETYELNFNKSISNLIFNLKVFPKQNLLLSTESNHRLYENALARAGISTAIFAFLAYIYLIKSRAVNLVLRSKEDVQTIINYYNREKSFIVNCYDYSKEDSELLGRLNNAGLIEDNKTHDYLPLFLTQSTDSNTVNYFNVNKLEFITLVQGYNLIHDSSISLSISNKTKSNNIRSFLCDELFIQLTESVTRNILQLKRNCNDGKVEITYLDDEIIWKCDLARITKEFLLKWSKSTFPNTGNPFVLNFRQIFQICEIFDIATEVNHNNTSLILKVMFKADESKSNTELKKHNIINFKVKNKSK